MPPEIENEILHLKLRIAELEQLVVRQRISALKLAIRLENRNRERNWEKEKRKMGA